MEIGVDGARRFVIGGACGHATPTGSAQNDWTTPTGYASATDPRYINPMAAAHRAKHQLGPRIEHAAAGAAAGERDLDGADGGSAAAEAEPMPPPEAVPDTTPPNTMPRDTGEVPPSVAPPLP